MPPAFPAGRAGAPEPEYPGVLAEIGAMGPAIARGGAATIAGAAEGAGIAQAQRTERLLRDFDAIDRGEIAPSRLGAADSATGLTDLTLVLPDLYRYENASPAERKVLRAQIMPKVDPRNTELFNWGAELRKSAEGAFPPDPRFTGRFSQAVGEGIGSMAAFMLAGVGTAGGAALPMGISGGAAEQFRDALLSGASLEQALEASNWGAAIGATEFIPIMRMLVRANRASGGKIRTAIIRGIQGGGEEAVQETFANVSRNLVGSDAVGYDPERGTFRGADQAAGAGFTVGAIAGTLAYLLGGRRSPGELRDTLKDAIGARQEPTLGDSRPPPPGAGPTLDPAPSGPPPPDRGPTLDPAPIAPEPAPPPPTETPPPPEPAPPPPTETPPPPETAPTPPVAPPETPPVEPGPVTPPPPVTPPAPGPGPATAPPVSPPMPVTPPGEVSTAHTVSGRSIDVRPEIVELDSLIASHDKDGAVNPAYPQDLQPRDRTKTESIEQVAGLVSKMNPELLAPSPLASEGAPIVGPDNFVDSGNARTLAIRELYRIGNPRYFDWLQAQGYDLSGFRQPVLIQRRVGDMTTQDRIAFNRDAATSSNLKRSPTEIATADARSITPALLQGYRGEELTKAINRQFVRDFIRNVIPLTERGGVYTRDGELSQEGERRIEAAIYAYAFDESEILGRMREDRDSNFKSIGNALIDVAPAWAVMRNAIEDAPQYDVTQAIIRGVRIVRMARQQGVPVASVLGQTDAYEGPVSPEIAAAVRLFYLNDDMTRWAGEPKIAERLRYYAGEARQMAQQAGTPFGDVLPILTPLELLQRAVDPPAPKMTPDVAVLPGQPTPDPFADALATPAGAASAARQSWNVFRGYGRPNRDSVYLMPGLGPILGPGRYYSLERGEAEGFGPALESGSITLDNPLIIRTDADWAALTRRAGVDPELPVRDVHAMLDDFDGPIEDFDEDSAITQEMRDALGKIRRAIEAGGHDGVALLWDPSAPAGQRRILEMLFDAPQVVDFQGRDLEERSQELSMAPRQPLPANVPDVIPTTFAKPLNEIEGYEDTAKLGTDLNAAIHAMKFYLTAKGMDDVIAWLDQGARLAPISERETRDSSVNAWPAVLASEIASRVGGGDTMVDMSFMIADHSSQSRGTDMDSLMSDPPRFYGRVEPGARYVLVDYKVTTGGSLLQLAAHIHSHGGKVVGAIAIETEGDGGKLRPNQATVTALRKKHGGIESAFREAFGYGYEALSQVEADWLAGRDRASVQSLIEARGRTARRDSEGVAETTPRRARRRGGGGGGTRGRRQREQAETLNMGPPGEHNVGNRRTEWDPRVPRRSTPITREKALRRLTKALGFTIYEGRIRLRSPTLGYFRSPIEEIRIKKPADIETAIHEAAHLLDHRFPEISKQWNPATKKNKPVRDELRNLSYDQDKLFEGFAEFVRFWATQPERAEEHAPLFSEWWDGFLERHPKEAKAVRQFRQDALAWFNQSELDKMRAKMGDQGAINAAVNGIWSRARQSVLDDLHGMYHMERDLTGAIQPEGPYVLARLTRGSVRLFVASLERGAPVLRPDGTIGHKGPGLDRILQPVMRDLDNWKLYAVARSASELKRQGRERLFTGSEIEAGLSLETPEFSKAFNQYQTWNNRIVDFAQALGVIDPRQRAMWKRAEYLPFYRIATMIGAGGERRGRPGEWGGIKELHGGLTNIRDPLENIQANAAMLIDMALKNRARQAVAEFAGMKGGAKYLARIPTETKAVKVPKGEVVRVMLQALGVRHPQQLDKETQEALEPLMQGLEPLATFFLNNQPPKGTNVLTVYVSGKPVYYEVADPVLLRSLSAFTRPYPGAVRRWFGVARRLVQMGITLTADFMSANAFRDTVTGFVFSRSGSRPFIETSRGFIARLTKDEDYWEFVYNGGGFSSFLVDEDAYRARVGAFYRKKGINPRNVILGLKSMALALETTAEAFEIATRLGEFKRAKARGKSSIEAAYDAREVSVDWGMRGDSQFVGSLYDTIIFLKAGMVSLDRVYRGFAHDPNKVSIMWKTAMIAGLSMGLYAFNKGNPLFDELEDWDRDGHWHFFIPTEAYYEFIERHGRGPQTPEEAADLFVHIRLPKIWEIGAIASISERTVEAISGEDVDTWNAIRGIFANLFGFEYAPAAIEPIYEQLRNKERFTDSPIVGRGQEGLPAWMQYRATTSETAKWLGKQLGVSPLRVEHLIYGYMNTWGRYGLTLMDAAFFDDGPDFRLDQMPVIRRFYRGKPARSTRHVQEFYDMLEAATEARRGLSALRRRRQPQEFQRLADSRDQEADDLLLQAGEGAKELRDMRDRILQAREIAELHEIATVWRDETGPGVGEKLWRQAIKPGHLERHRRAQAAAARCTANAPQRAHAPSGRGREGAPGGGSE